MAPPVAVSLLALVLSTGVFAAPVQVIPRDSELSAPWGYRSVLFYDIFANYKAGSQPSRNKWTYDTGTSYPGGPEHWGTGEVQRYTKSTTNIVITKSGTLKITPVKSRGRWTSARIQTTKKHDFSCPAGKKILMEASVNVGNAPANRQLGIWPAFWALGSAYRGNYQNWPSVSEIDVMELLNGGSTVYQTLHCGSAGGGPCNEPYGLGARTGFARGAFHTVGLEIDRTNPGGDWRGERLVWYLDGQVTKVITGASLNSQAAWNAVARHRHFLLLNVAVGGGFPDAIAGTRTPNSATASGSVSAMEVKYVAVFQT